MKCLGYNFDVWDINDGGLLDKLGLAAGELHYVLISYVMIYVTNNPVLDMLRDLLVKEGVRALIMSERSESTAACAKMESRGIFCSRLMSQKLGKDERQCVFVSDRSILHSSSGRKSGDDDVVTDPAFPNVPFCEHKEKRAELGKPLNWRPFHEDNPIKKRRR